MYFNVHNKHKNKITRNSDLPYVMTIESMYSKLSSVIMISIISCIVCYVYVSVSHQYLLYIHFSLHKK